MKKIGIGIFVILLLILAFIYIFVPSGVEIAVLTGAQATIHGEFRSINQEEKWAHWWRDEKGHPPAKGAPFTYNGTIFRLKKQASNTVQIQIEQGGMRLESILQLLSFSMDSTGAAWTLKMPATNNPVRRIQYYRIGILIRNNMLAVMQNLSAYVSSPKNVYGMDIYTTSTRDTLLVSSRFKSATYPTTAELYRYFDTLEMAIHRQNAQTAGFPIMNLRKMEDGSYETQAAIPANRKMVNDGKITAMRMVPGLFMAAEITGGSRTVDEALLQMEMFIQEYHRVKMATSFQILVTNRLKEPDTAKWKTKIFIPVAP